MKLPPFFRWLANRSRLPLPLVLVLPFVLQTFGTVALVGYLCYRSGQQTVEDLASELMEEVGDRIHQNLQTYLSAPEQINQLNAATIRQGNLAWQNFSVLEQHFVQQLKILPDISGVGIATEQREFLSVNRPQANAFVIRQLNRSTADRLIKYRVNAAGQRQQLPESQPSFDPQNAPPDDPWYEATKAAHQSNWRLVVSLAQGAEQPMLTVTNFLPFYDRADRFQGVLGATLYLTQIGDFLKSLKVGKTGQTFILDQNGLLIATSTGDSPFQTDAVKTNAVKKIAQNLDPTQRRLSAFDSKNRITQAATQFLANRAGNLRQISQRQQSSFELDQQRYFVQITPLQHGPDLNWLIVAVVPQADFTAEIQQNSQTMILVSATTLLLSIGLGILTARRFTRPVSQLNTAARRLSQGDFDTQIASDRTDELGELSRCFDDMALQLQSAFAGMRVLNQVLAEGESNMRQILETLPVGVSMHRPDGSIAYINPTGKQLLEIDELDTELTAEKLQETYRVYRSSTNKPYPIEQFPAFLALQGQSVMADDIDAHFGDRIVAFEARSAPVFDYQGNVIAAINTFHDISERREAENILADYSRKLEAQVTARTQALQESEERFRRAFDDAEIGMAIVSLNNRFLRVNRALGQMLGYSEAEFLSFAFHEITHPDDLIDPGDMETQVIKTGTFQREKRYLHKQGHTVWALLSVSLLRDCSSQPLYYISQVQDISDRKRAEAALRQSEERSRAIVAAIPDMMKLYSADGIYLSTVRGNPSIDLITEDCDPIGKHLSELIPAEVAAKEIQLFQQALDTGEVQVFEQQVQVGDKLQYEEVRIAPCGQDTILLMIRDISTRKRTEAALRQSEERNRAILSAIPDLITIVNADGIYLDSIWNNSAINLIPDTVDPIGKHISELIPAELLPRKLRAIQTAVATREIQAYEQEVWISNRLQYEELRVVPYGADTALLIIRDITDRRRAEEALRQSEERWQLAIQGSHDGIWDQNLITKEYFLSPRCVEMLGYSNQELNELNTQDNWINHVHPNDRTRVQTTFQKHLDCVSPFYTCEYRMRCKDGSYKWLLARGQAHWNKQGQPIRAVGSITDITDLKHSEEELRLAKESAEAASRAKSAFLANMSHELRTPLNAILGFTQLMTHDRSIPLFQQNHLEVINRNGEYLLQLINDVLSISKIEAGRVTLEEHSFDLFALLDTLEGMFRLQAETKGLQFVCDCPPSLPQYIHTDERKLRQIITNLLDNAIKFTQAGSVTLRVRRQEAVPPILPSPHPPIPPSLLFEIQDTGVGIAADELDTIFDAFVQSESGRNSLHGTGLGLAISRRFTQLMGGDITVSSRVGQGTVFQIILPLKPADAEAVKVDFTAQRVVKLVPNQPTYRVLVADDTDTNRHLLVQWLSAVGFEVREANNGQEAIEQWSEFAPHLIWIDMRMPIMDGFEAIKCIRQQERNAPVSTKIIAITAAVFAEEQRRILATGCDDVVSKPCPGSVIFEKMAHHLGVKYLYEERIKNQYNKQERSASPSSAEINPALKSALLEIMSAEWMAQLNHAARRANEREILQLLEKIPVSHQTLKEPIVHLIQNFKLEQLIQLTQPSNV